MNFVAQGVVDIQLRIFCVVETNRLTTAQLPRERERHLSFRQTFRIDFPAFSGIGDWCPEAQFGLQSVASADLSLVLACVAVGCGGIRCG